jgi:2-succinyl-5-enolpyruvyl-6-hydroxy-3-cyclohexene-1-carboxylate synthase
MQHVGANQTIEQTHMFGDRVRWRCEIPAADLASDWNGYWRSTVSQAVARALGFAGRPGPVHLNVAFREPTVPVTDDGRTVSSIYPHPIEGRAGGGPWQTHHRSGPATPDLVLPTGGPGLVIAGEGDYDAVALVDAAEARGWPVLATALSGARGPGVVTTYHHLLVGGVPAPLVPQLVISVGRIGPSDRLGLLTGLDVPQIQVDRWGTWTDPRRHSTHMVQADPVEVVAMAAAADGALLYRWRAADSAIRSALDERLHQDAGTTGPSTARALSGLGYDLMVAASSMPVRDLDAHTIHEGRVISNRGASGIDGFVSTALGAASAGARTIALTGDLSLLHDAGGLATRPPVDVVFVVIDNGGGGLFDLLPQADHAPDFERLFVASHGLDLAAVGQAYGVIAGMATTIEEMTESVADSLGSGGPHLIVVPVDRETDLKMRRGLDDTARTVVAGLT